MKSVFLPFLGWAGALQTMASATTSLDTMARILGLAAVLGSLTVLVYRLGVWRQEMEHAKQGVGAPLESHRRESAAAFARLEERLDGIDRALSSIADHREATTRWQLRADTRLSRLEQDGEPYAPDRR